MFIINQAIWQTGNKNIYAEWTMISAQLQLIDLLLLAWNRQWAAFFFKFSHNTFYLLMFEMDFNSTILLLYIFFQHLKEINERISGEIVSA